MGFLQWSSDKPCDKPWDFAVSYFQTCRNVHLRQATIQLLRAHGAQWWPTVQMARNDKKCRNANEVASKTVRCPNHPNQNSHFSVHWMWVIFIIVHMFDSFQLRTIQCDTTIKISGSDRDWRPCQIWKIWPFVRRTWCWKMGIDGIVR